MKTCILLLMLGFFMGCAGPGYHQVDPFPAAMQKGQIIKTMVPNGSTYEDVLRILGEPKAKKPFRRAIDCDEEWVYVLDQDLKPVVNYGSNNSDFFILRLLFGNKKVGGSLLLPLAAYTH